MIPPDWKTILSHFEGHCTAGKGWSHHYRNSVHSLVHFLEAGSHTYLDKEVMMAWIGERSARRTLEHVMIEFSHLKKFIHHLSGQGLCTPDLLSRMRTETALLNQVPGPHYYCARLPQLQAYWQAILSDFELSLRGYTPLYIAHILRTANEYSAEYSISSRIRCPYGGYSHFSNLCMRVTHF